MLTAICDKGPNGRYLVTNLSRNKKAYITSSDSCEDVKKIYMEK